MSFILNIDTATEFAQVSIASNEKVLQTKGNTSQKDHASFLHSSIKQMLSDYSFKIQDIDAVAVTAGPGSYTGLRVGLSSAKGLCYALHKPLITINTLEVLAVAAQQLTENTAELLICPMIDARRMEVFTAIYSKDLTALLAPCAMILQNDSLLNYLIKHKIIFCGNGAAKFKNVCTHTNASFANISENSTAMAILSARYFMQKRFADLAYADPFYLKDFKSNL